MRNRIRCIKCGNIIESKSRHDFVWCSCHSVAVDGGHDYQRICFDKIENVIRVLDDDTEEPVDREIDEKV